MVGGFWFISQFVNHRHVRESEGGVACEAHIGELVAGMVLIVLLKG